MDRAAKHTRHEEDTHDAINNYEMQQLGLTVARYVQDTAHQDQHTSSETLAGPSKSATNSSKSASESNETFANFDSVNSMLEERVQRGQRLCPRCYTPNDREYYYSVVRCRSCSNPFQWTTAVKVAIGHTPSQFDDTAMASGKITEHDSSFRSTNGRHSQAEQGFSSRAGEESSSRGRSVVDNLYYANRSIGGRAATAGIEDEIQPCESGPSTRSRQRYRSKSPALPLPRPFTADSIVSDQPLYPTPMGMRPLADMTAPFASIFANNETYKAAEQAKEPLRAR